MKLKTYLVLAGLALIAACGVRPQPPTPQPPPPVVEHVRASFQMPEGVWATITKATLEVDTFGFMECEWDEGNTVVGPGFVDCAIPASVPKPFGAHLNVDAVGAEHYNYDFALKATPDFGTWQLVPTPNDAPDIGNPKPQVLTAEKPPAPVIATFSRQYRLDAGLVFAGETICTSQYGCVPWFEPAYQTLVSAEDRKAVRDQKRTVYHDRGIILECATNAASVYGEPGVWTQNANTRSCEQEPAWFKGLVDEILTETPNPLVPILAYDGDDGSAGHRNAMRQLPILSALFAGYDSSVIWARLWDGVFYGSTPEEIQQFGTAFRSTHGDDAVLLIEHNPGHIPAGKGQADFQRGGALEAYDIVAGEFDSLAALKPAPGIVGAKWDEEHGGYAPVWDGDDGPLQRIWQILARVNFGYNPPPNQPFDVLATAQDGPQKGQQVRVSADKRVSAREVYLVDSTRGPRRYWVFEDGEYEWVRNWVSLADLRREGDYYRRTGAPVVCLP